jgi:hypothetical protein
LVRQRHLRRARPPPLAVVLCYGGNGRAGKLQREVLGRASNLQRGGGGGQGIPPTFHEESALDPKSPPHQRFPGEGRSMCARDCLPVTGKREHAREALRLPEVAPPMPENRVACEFRHLGHIMQRRGRMVRSVLRCGIARLKGVWIARDRAWMVRTADSAVINRLFGIACFGVTKLASLAP